MSFDTPPQSLRPSLIIPLIADTLDQLVTHYTLVRWSAQATLLGTSAVSTMGFLAAGNPGHRAGDYPPTHLLFAAGALAHCLSLTRKKSLSVVGFYTFALGAGLTGLDPSAYGMDAFPSAYHYLCAAAFVGLGWTYSIRNGERR
ncbi:MAG TPA: hypothetical protein VJH22_07460 [Candidatus Nanoarchaeia archaeon]|nr:hypothetical protein [Candidatus Nanoarchaeia archaeon]